jgi:predicted nucleic acid-binding protein
MKAIADTGFLVAFANRRDRYHDWALALASQISEPLLTCEPVLAETAFHLQNAALVLAFIQEGLVVPALNVLEQLSPLVQLAARFADRKPDLADLCLVRLSELYPKHKVITIDVEDFRIYRRNRNEKIPLLTPPGLD